jgi:hypothetical protein
MLINIYTAWIAFLLGCIAGAVSGMFFHKKDWMGGYDSWQRRLVRLAHISFFGIGFLNLAFALTVKYLGLETGIIVPAVLLVVGAATMPVVCYLSAWKPLFRHIFFIPAGSVILSLIFFLWRIFKLVVP